VTDPRVQRWVRPEVRELQAYAVHEPGGLIKLDAMENPYGWPEWLTQAWLQVLAEVPLNRYPDAGASRLCSALREAYGLSEGQGLILGNGSDELIQILALAVSRPDRVVLAPDPTFVMYRMIATFAGMGYVGVPLQPDFRLDREAVLAAVQRHEPALTFLAYPNNPSGNHWDRADVEAVIEASPGLVVVDEAYAPFARDSFLGDLGRYDNLLVMRTLSKLGLAGLRLGLLCGPPAWLQELEKLRLPYNINSLTQASAAFALRHGDVLDEQAVAIRRDRARLAQALASLPGIQPYPSDANFILFRTPGGQATVLFERLKAAGILVKDLSNAGGLLADCLRVTVGTPEENARFVEALEAAL